MYILSFQILIDVVPTLPDIPLPPIQANYRPLPSIESITCSQTKRKGMLGRKTGLKRAAGTAHRRQREWVPAGLSSCCWRPVPCLMPGAWAAIQLNISVRGAFTGHLVPPPEHLRLWLTRVRALMRALSECLSNAGDFFPVCFSSFLRKITCWPFPGLWTCSS